MDLSCVKDSFKFKQHFNKLQLTVGVLFVLRPANEAEKSHNRFLKMGEVFRLCTGDADADDVNVENKFQQVSTFFVQFVLKCNFKTSKLNYS